MEDINAVVSTNLKRLREERRLSLDAVARLSGVSKSMLGQIERGEVNPTISTVWKIANGLKMSFTELMTRPETDFEVIDRKSIQPLTACDGKYRNFPLFPFDSVRRFEVYYIELDEGADLKADPHPEGTQEFVTVFGSALSITVDEHRLDVPDGCSARFRSDRPHVYKNEGKGLCRLSMVIYYPEPQKGDRA